ncbi:MAG: alpha/beta hydrolase [Planctomycetaceae bacterium]|nr:alpha/beta hydrolase [Planctomycetaceae bacterium]
MHLIQSATKLPRCLIIVLACCVTAAPAIANDNFDVTPDVVYGHKAGMALTFDVITPRENAKNVGVLFMVSGGWVSFWFPPEHVVDMQARPFNNLAALSEEGYTLFLVRHGSSPYFKVPDAVSDVRRAVRYIRLHAGEYGVDPNRLGVVGGSAGGHLSLMLGTTGDDGNPQADDVIEQQSDRVAAVVSLYPPTQLDEYFQLDQQFPALQFDHNLAESVSPLMHVTPDDAPTLLVHGDKDELVPANNSERIFERFGEENVDAELIVIEGAAHGFKGEDADRATRAMVTWFNKHLSAPASRE